MTTGERIKQRRKSLRLSAEALAASVGASPAQMYRYENGGAKKIPGELLLKIATKLQTNISYLLGEATDADMPQGFIESYPTAEEARKAWEAAQWSAMMDGDILSTPEEKELLKAYRSAEPVYQGIALEILKAHPRIQS